MSDDDIKDENVDSLASGHLDLNDWLLAFSEAELGVSPDEMKSIIEQASLDGAAIHETALKQGLLDVVQADMLGTLTSPDTTLPDYQFLDVLGRGAMGVVYRAKQRSLDRIVAIKTILLSLAGRSANQRFEQEAKTVAQLRHPNILSAYDLHSHSGRLYLILEFLEGETVEGLLKRRTRVDEFTAWHLIRQAASGLAHASEHGIVHRDIKPANLFCVDPPAGFPLPAGVPLLKITDFGLALLHQDEDATRVTQAGSTLGTPAYMAPEQVDESDVDQRADIYALGVTAFKLISGQLPFTGRTLALMTKKIAEDAPRLSVVFAGCHPASSQLVGEMLARDPSDRIADYQLLISRIDSLLGGLTKDESGAVEETRVVDLRRKTVLDEPTNSSESTDELDSTPIEDTHHTETTHQSKSRGLVKWSLVAVGVFALAGIGFTIWSDGIGSAPLPSTKMVRTNRSEYLFDGTNASGWTSPGGGSVRVVKNTENSPVLGIESAAQHRIPPYENYSLSFGLDLQQASSCELHFGFEKSNGNWMLRLTEKGIQIARVDSGGKRSQTRSVDLRRSPWARQFGDEPIYRDVRVETEPGRCVIMFDGKQIAAIPSLGDDRTHIIGLVATDGMVHLDNVLVVETQPAK